MVSRVHALAVTLGALALSPLRAQALDTDACVRSYEEAQRQRMASHLRRAREELLRCAQPSCPAAASEECTRWLREVDDSLPSVVIVARDDHHRDVLDGRVLVDGEVQATALSGAPLALDPGAHVVRVEGASGLRGEQSIVVRVGEKNRRVEIEVRARERSSEAPSTRRGPGALPFVLGGVSLVALTSFAYFGLKARSDLDALDARCGGHCPASEVDATRTKALVADVSLGISLLSLAGAAYLLLSADIAGGEAMARSAEPVRVEARRDGAGLSWETRF